jgi:2-polyprenyl-3-methyl-5-hydroxy-6-metoxy-1,4-benzoquinol methylase
MFSSPSAHAAAVKFSRVENTLRQTSYEQTKTRFDSANDAAIYSRKHGGHARDRREQHCIAAAMQACNLAPDSYVLDLPCGAGRLSPMIIDAGHRLVAADSSPHMVSEAEKAWRQLNGNDAVRRAKVTFEVRDVMATGYASDTFEVVICNRLLHHFTEPATRSRALAELARISKRYVIASFFNAGALDARRKKLGQIITGKVATKRVPIKVTEFAVDAAIAGLRIVGEFPTFGMISPQHYVLLERADRA